MNLRGKGLLFLILSCSILWLIMSLGLYKKSIDGTKQHERKLQIAADAPSQKQVTQGLYSRFTIGGEENNNNNIDTTNKNIENHHDAMDKIKEEETTKNKNNKNSIEQEKNKVIISAVQEEKEEEQSRKNHQVNASTSNMAATKENKAVERGANDESKMNNGWKAIPTHLKFTNTRCRHQKTTQQKQQEAIPQSQIPMSQFEVKRNYDHTKYNDSMIQECLRDEMSSIIGNRGEEKLREKPVRIFDGFTFNDEFDILEVRLNELHKVVDYFIIVEARMTLQNKPKLLHFMQNKARFAKFEKQILHVVVETQTSDFKYWENESLFRNSIGSVGLQKLIDRKQGIDSNPTDKVYGEADPPTDDDLINISDVDEMPHPDALYLLKWHHHKIDAAVSYSMRWMYYGYTRDNGSPWNKCNTVTFRALRDASSKLNTNTVRYSCANKPQVKVGSMSCFAGWHCSWCLHPKSYVVKMNSFAHVEMKQSLEHMGRTIETEDDVWGLIKDGHYVGGADDLGEFVSVEHMKKQMSANLMMPLYMFASFKQYPYFIYPDPSVTHYKP